MTGPPAATAAVRVAVRRALRDLDGPVAAAVSGGADSLALAAALAFERPGSGALVVDHGLQPGSAEIAARAAEQCRALGLSAEVLTAPSWPSARSSEDRRRPDAEDVPKILDAGGVGDAGDAGDADAGGVGDAGDAGDADGSGDGGDEGGEADEGADPREDGGPEARARVARYAALERAAAAKGLSAVLLGHTRDDQAETVLLGLGRGSGGRALAGMAPVRGLYRRPLLDLPRSTTRAACAEAGLVAWEDPHNSDLAYARVRVRTTALPALERALGPGVAAALARTAAQLREDADALDALTPDTDDVTVLAALPAALRARALKRWAEYACGTQVTAAHVDALRALVEDWRGQGPVALPGGVRVRRDGPRLASAP